MSRQEVHKGKLVLFTRLDEEQDKEYMIRFCNKIGEEFKESEWEDDLQEYIYEADLYEKVFLVKGKLFENTQHKEYEDYDFHEFDGNEVEGFTYFTSFYNGGGCLSEIIEEELTKRI